MGLETPKTTVTADEAARLCPQCVTPLRPLQTYCSGKCRVAAFRKKAAPVRRKVNERYQRERRSAISSVPQLRDVGRDGDLRRLKEIEAKCIAARKELRSEFKKKRDAYKADMRQERVDAQKRLNLRKAQIKYLGRALQEAIDKSDAAIRGGQNGDH